MISSGEDVWGEEVLLSLRGFWAHIFTSAAHMTSLNKAAAAAAKLLQSCPTLRPRGLQPTRLLHPWDFPGKSTGVGRHCLLPSMHDYWKNHRFDYTDLCQQSDVSAFQYSKFVTAFLPRNKRLLISWPQSLSAVIL